MKTTFAILWIVLLAAFGTQAQTVTLGNITYATGANGVLTPVSTNNVPVPITSSNLPPGAADVTLNFFQQAMAWGSSINLAPDHDWANVSIQIDTGVATTTGVGIADRLDAQKNFGSFGIGLAAEFTGIGSTFNLIEGTFQYSVFKKGDFKMTAELGGGWDSNAKNAHGKTTGAIVGEPGVGIYKIMTPSSYAVMKLLMPVESHGKFSQQPKIYVGVGGTF